MPNTLPSIPEVDEEALLKQIVESHHETKQYQSRLLSDEMITCFPFLKSKDELPLLNKVINILQKAKKAESKPTGLLAKCCAFFSSSSSTSSGISTSTLNALTQKDFNTVEEFARRYDKTISRTDLLSVTLEFFLEKKQSSENHEFTGCLVNPRSPR